MSRARAEAEALQSESNAANGMKDVTDTVLVEIVLQSQHGRAGVDADHIGADPLQRRIHIAETISACDRPAAIVRGPADVVQNQLGMMSNRGEGGRHMRGAVDGTAGSVT